MWGAPSRAQQNKPHASWKPSDLMQKKKVRIEEPKPLKLPPAMFLPPAVPLRAQMPYQMMPVYYPIQYHPLNAPPPFSQPLPPSPISTNAGDCGSSHGGSSTAPAPPRPRPNAAPVHASRRPSLRVLDIVSPFGRKVKMIFVERARHVTAHVEYGLVPADPKARELDKSGNMIGNEGMENLSPLVYQDVPARSFFYAELRPVMNIGKDGANVRKPTPTILQQLVDLGVLKVVPGVHPKIGLHKEAVLVRVMLSEYEMGHACMNPDHPVVYEHPNPTRFGVCTGCLRAGGRRFVYYCTQECLQAAWPKHRIHCSQPEPTLRAFADNVNSILKIPLTPVRDIEACKHNPEKRDRLLRQYYAEKNSPPVDLSEWKKNVLSRKANGCKNLLPGL